MKRPPPPPGFPGRVDPDAIELVVRGGGLKVGTRSAQGDFWIALLLVTIFSGTLATPLMAWYGPLGGPYAVGVWCVGMAAFLLSRLRVRGLPESTRLVLRSHELRIDGTAVPITAITRIEREEEVVTVEAGDTVHRFRADHVEPWHLVWFLARVTERRRQLGGHDLDAVPPELRKIAEQ